MQQVLRLPAGNQSVANRGRKTRCSHSQPVAEHGGLRTSSPPVTAPVNINHHLLSPGLLAADVERGAAIAVTVTG